MKITLTQKSEVRPLSDDETEIEPEKEIEIEVVKYTAINTTRMSIRMIDYNGKECKDYILGVGLVELDERATWNNTHFPKLIKVAISEDDLKVRPFEPIPGFHSYKMLEVL